MNTSADTTQLGNEKDPALALTPGPLRGRLTMPGGSCSGAQRKAAGAQRRKVPGND